MSEPWRLRGEAHGRAKLTEADVRDIRARFVWGSRTDGQNALARQYGVYRRTVQDIVNNVNWTHVK